MSGSYGVLNQKYNTLLARVLNGGSGGGGSATLNDVLTNGNTTTLTADFQSGTSTTTIEGNRIGLDNSVLGIAKSIELDNATGASPNIQVTTASVSSLTKNTLSSSALTFTFGTPPTLSTAGISQVGTGVQINTNGTLTLNGLGGSNGQVLTYNSGNAVWATSSGGTTIQRGETAVASMNSTSGTVTYGTPFATKPYVVLSFNNNGNLTFIPIGVLSHQQNASLQYTGFTWASASTSSTATITWYATI